MRKIVLTENDDSTVDFLGPEAVAAAVAEAVATTTTPKTLKEVDAVFSDGEIQTLVPKV